MRALSSARTCLPRRPVVAAALALLCAAPTLAGNGSASRGRQSPQRGAAAFDARVELVTLSVSVLDRHGAPIADLQQDDFRIWEDGDPREAALVLTPDETPLDIALLVDLSGSMRDADWRERAAGFLSSLSARDCVFLLGFSTLVGGAVWGAPDDEILFDALDDADAAGGTALFDALLVALRELDAADSGGTLRGAARGSLNPDVRGARAVGVRPNNPCPAAVPAGRADDPTHLRRRAIVVVSDGADSSSASGADDVLTAAELTGVPIFPIELEAGGGGRRGRPRRGMTPVPDWARDGVLAALAEATGGRTVSGASGYEGVLAWLRGSYILGFYTTANRVYGGDVDFTRHEVEIELRGGDAELVYPPAYFRAAIDTEAARYDVEQATDLMAAGNLDAALMILDRAIRADPDYAPAYFNRAIARGDAGRLSEAQQDALRAATLSPGVADLHELAMLISIDVQQAAPAWEQAVLAAQAGVDLSSYLDRLETLGPAPVDFDAQVSAPSIMVARPYSDVTNLLLDTALARVFQTIRQRLAATAGLGVVVDPSRAAYIMTIRGDRLGGQRPRRLEGQLIVHDPSGREVYSKAFLLNDVDSPSRIAEDLARLLRDLEDKLTR